MDWLIYIAGIATGAGGYFLYDKVHVSTQLKALEQRLESLEASVKNGLARLRGAL